MKKTNITTIIIFAAVIVSVVVFTSVSNAINAKREAEEATYDISETQEITSDISVSKNASQNITTSQPETTHAENTQPKKTISMKDALFIGDSRTVGISEYGKIKGADFFCDVGMSCYNIYDKKLSVASVGKVKLKTLFKEKQYGKIYIMLGINEIGYDFENTVNKYKELIQYIQKKQPDAKILIEANLHVTKERSDNDKVVNNKRINKFNKAIEKLTDNKTIFYIDINTLFDDRDGALATDKTADNTHIYAKYYKDWGEWIVSKTAELLEDK